MRLQTSIIALAWLLIGGSVAAAQQDRWTDTLTVHAIERNDGTELRGRVVTMNPRELTIALPDGTRLVLPKHLVRTIKPLEGPQAQEQAPGAAVQTAIYVLTSGAQPMPRGTSSLQFNIAGIALEAFPTERFSVGLLASWFSAPIVATAMYRMPLGDNLWLGAGGFIGWGGSLADRNFLAAPTLTLSMKSGSTNVSLTGGFGATSLGVETYDRPDYSGQFETTQIVSPRAYAALGISVKLSRKIRLIVDAFMITSSGSQLLPDGRWMRNSEYDYNNPSNNFTRDFETFSNIFIIPAIRWEYSTSSFWQFGFAGYKGNLLDIQNNSDWSPLPIPVVQWVMGL